jgi:peptidyl-prolyl cis-trans isomerase C
MYARFRYPLVGCALLTIAGILIAQPTPVPIQLPKDPPPPARSVVAARVNSQVIPELSVYRGLMRVPPAKRAESRKDVLNFLIDNAIVDQYLLQLKIAVEAKEIEDHIGRIKKEAAAEKMDYKQLLDKLMVTDEELRTELTGALRWDKFVAQQGTDDKLRPYFNANIEMFNGSRMHARHILVPAGVDGVTKITVIKKNIEKEVAQAVAKLPTSADAITREKERAKVLEDAFAKAATDHSTCTSKDRGGDLNYFPRVGVMVEPFARAAFALKPYQMSEPVTTEFGVHLILAVDYKPGKEVKYEDVKPFVMDVYGERLREAVLNQYKGKIKIEIVELKK